MRIIAYTYEADYHCIECTNKRFAYYHTGDVRFSDATDKAVKVDWNGIYVDQLDNEGNLVHPVFSIDEWYDINKPSVFADGTCDHDWDWQCVCNDTQYLACGDCHEVIEEYTHTN